MNDAEEEIVLIKKAKSRPIISVMPKSIIPQKVVPPAKIAPAKIPPAKIASKRVSSSKEDIVLPSAKSTAKGSTKSTPKDSSNAELIQTFCTILKSGKIRESRLTWKNIPEDLQLFFLQA